MTIKTLTRKVAYLEKVFDVIHRVHIGLVHSRDVWVHKLSIDKTWWGVTETAIRFYRDLCPECLKSGRPSKAEEMVPLKMMISETIGSRAQMDLIDYRWREENGFKWILRDVNHLMGFAHVVCLKNKKAATVGRAMVKILSVAVLLDILQSDNGGEFLGQCITYIKKYFPTINIVKGRARKPSTQGSVERGNGPFKIALENLMQDNPSESWSRIGAFVVNASINSRPLTAKSNRSPYEAYYGKICVR